MSHAKVRRRARHEEHEEHENHERWLVSYADMITVLMALFIVLFAMSTIDETKFWELRASLASSFGHELAAVQAGRSPVPGDSAPEGPLSSGPIMPGSTDVKNQIDQAIKVARSKEAMAQAQATRAQVEKEVEALEKIRKAIAKALQGTSAAKSVRFRYDERGLVVSVITDAVMFAPDRAELTETGREIVHAFGPVLRSAPNDLLIEGHTNTVPVSPKFYPSEWELSSARASAVVRRMVEAEGIAPNRLSATGWADQRPLIPGTSAEANRVNRRVEIVVGSTLAPTDRSLLGTVAAQQVPELSSSATSAAKEQT
ncbi:OmpA/MotB family protein [Sporichthya polymorpha]|uniref:OmpA/MotB family protein n=1 Tax=Sporichthya polymorpha TaxID=35751 RepID=UPI0003799BA9|nr:flagellar motor protein MotB [Sporichthya polymorpha]